MVSDLQLTKQKITEYLVLNEKKQQRKNEVESERVTLC